MKTVVRERSGSFVSLFDIRGSLSGRYVPGFCATGQSLQKRLVDKVKADHYNG
jgi:hypothetical protein